VFFCFETKKKNSQESEQKAKTHNTKRRSKQTNIFKKLDELYRSMMYQFSKKRNYRKTMLNNDG
jgi:hypothetical protein